MFQPLNLIAWPGLAVLLLALAAAVTPLDGVALGVGLAGSGVVIALLRRALRRAGTRQPTPADRVTLFRALLGMVVTALVVQGLQGAVAAPLLVTVALAALALDGVDGRLARRDRQVTPLGARFDMEVDAWLILVLSVHAMPRVGAWVLAIGLARYALLAAGMVVPWLRAPMPPRWWNKFVAALQGIALTLAAAELLPRPVMTGVLVVAAALLAESFGHQVAWLYAHRQGRVPPAPARPPGSVGRAAVTVVAAALVWVALAAPNMSALLVPEAFLTLPLGWIGIVALACVLPRRALRAGGLAIGACIGLLVLVKLLDIGFFAAFDRPVDLATDAYYLAPGYGVLRDTFGTRVAAGIAVGAALGAAGILILLPWATLRLMQGVAGVPRAWTLRATGALATAWIVLAVGDVRTPTLRWDVASTGAFVLAHARLAAIPQTLDDRRRFARDIAADPLAAIPADDLLTALRGKDVLLVFVESYGRVALQDPALAPGVGAVLGAGTRALAANGYAARSAFLISPTFGGGSWLAHASLESGLWVDSQHRYAELLGSSRLTLARAFRRAGWRTVSVAPADASPWRAGQAFYGYARLYGAHDLGYRGPRFGYATMPDQFTLSAFRRLELERGARPRVFAEIDLVSSHAPWTPLPRRLPWAALGDGAPFAQAATREPEIANAEPDAVKRRYAASIRYTLATLTSFLSTWPDPDLVVIVLGDHQPWQAVSGADAPHTVPIALIAADPAVMQRIDAWRWERGLRPGPDAPTWPMSAFRDRFLRAFSGASPEAARAPDASP